MRLIGIYRITSQIHPDRIYIGSSVRIDRRWKEHLKMLRSNKHANVKLMGHVNKYGIEDLVFSIVESFVFISKEHLLSREQYYIDTLHPSFNMCMVAGSCLGIKQSEERCRKNGDRKRGNTYFKGRHHTEEAKQKNREKHLGISVEKNKKPINQYDLDMNFIREWGFINEAAIALCVDISNISKCLRREQKTAYGFIWEYKFDKKAA